VNLAKNRVSDGIGQLGGFCPQRFGFNGA